MIGSDKQIKWAQDILSAAHENIETMRKARARCDAIPGERPDNNLYDLTSACINAIATEYETVIAQIENTKDFPAAALIDNRAKFGWDAMYAHAKDWMRFNG